MRLKHGDFLLDVLILACTSFGGPQVHFALFLDRLVKKRAYLSEEEMKDVQNNELGIFSITVFAEKPLVTNTEQQAAKAACCGPNSSCC